MFRQTASHKKKKYVPFKLEVSYRGANCSDKVIFKTGGFRAALKFRASYALRRLTLREVGDWP